MTPGPEADRVLLAHMRECIERIREYTGSDRGRFEASRLVQDAVVRNLQTLTESSQRLSDGCKATEPTVPWRELAGFRNVIVHGYLGIDHAAIWLVVEQDLPPLADALDRMAARSGLKSPPSTTSPPPPTPAAASPDSHPPDTPPPGT